MTESSPTRLPRGTLDASVIVDAALDAISELGIDRLTIPAVAKRVGVRPTAIYWHFRRKEDLLEARDARALERFNRQFPVPSTRSWRRNVRTYWTEYRRILRDDPVLSELIVVRWATSL